MLGRPVPRAAAVALAVALAVAAVVALGAMRLLGPEDEGSGRGSAGAASVTAKVEPTTTSTSATTSAPETTSAPATTKPAGPATKPCDQDAAPFTPRRIDVPGVTHGAAVVEPPREAGNVPGTPPLTSAGKTMFAYDVAQGVRPGDAAGNVLLNAHTWPDGTALGNRLLAGLQQGDRIVVRGTTAKLCYRVTERVEVLASKGLPRYYATDGPPQIAIVVCSGRRLGPGDWEKRTVWFARPAV